MPHESERLRGEAALNELRREKEMEKEIERDRIADRQFMHMCFVVGAALGICAILAAVAQQ